MRPGGMLARGRRAANARMVDECEISRPGAAQTDPETGDVTTATEPVYTGRCEVQSKATVPTNPEAGEHAFTVVASVIKIPANAADVKDGDVVTLKASRHNAFTNGKQYRVEGFTPDTFDTAFRLPVKEIL